MRLLDLGFGGACIEHIHPLPDWHLYYLDVPPALGGARLQGEVVWSQGAGRTEVAEGKSVVCYRSGLRFTLLSAQQQAGLAAALEILKAAQGR